MHPRRPPLAAQGQLDIIAAGPKAALEYCQPLFSVLGKQTFVVGDDPAKANAVKIARNFLLACLIESLGEAFALVRRCGVAPADFLNVIGNTSLGSPAYRNYGRMIVEQAWLPAQFAMPLGVKDVELALATAREAGMHLRLGEMIRGHLLEAIAAGRAEVLGVLERWAAQGLRVLAVARRRLEDGVRPPDSREEAEHDLCLLGLVGLFDPPRPGVAEAVERCRPSAELLLRYSVGTRRRGLAYVWSPIDAERIGKREHVGDQRIGGIVGDILRPVGFAEATQVRRDGAEPVRDEEWNLVAPKIGRVRPPM